MTTRRAKTTQETGATSTLDPGATPEATTQEPAFRRCIGSATFGIEAHEAPIADFPVQPSQKDGLGRMCKPHWNQYTTALRKAALARKAADPGPATTGDGTTAESAPTGEKPRRPKAIAEADAAPAAEA